MKSGEGERLEIQLVPIDESTEHLLVQSHAALISASMFGHAAALLTLWGSRHHRLAGRVAAASGAIALLLILPLARMSPITWWTGCATLYLLARGLWWIRSAPPRRSPWPFGLAVTAAAPPLLGWTATCGQPGQAIGLALFSPPVAWLVYQDARLDPDTSPPATRRVQHLTGMVGAMTLSWENFLPRRLTPLHGVLPDLAVALLPAATGLLLIVLLRRRAAAD